MKIVSKSVILVLLLLSLILTACQGTAASTPEAAPAVEDVSDAADASADQVVTGELTVACGAQEDWCQAMTQSFEAKTGIKTNYVRLSSGEALARFIASKDNPEFDVWHGGPADGYIAAKNEGLLEPYISPSAALVPDQLKDADGSWTGVYIGALGFCSNADVLNDLGVDVPTSWDDLLDPALKEQVAIAHPATSGTAYTAFWTLATLNGGDQEKAFEYFAELHNNILQYTKSGSAPGQMAGRGEVAVAIIFSHDCVKFNEEGMTSLVVSFPEEGTGYEIGGAAILKGVKNLPAAQMYIDFVLSKEGQEIGPTVKSYQLPTNPEATVSDKVVKLSEVNLVSYDFIAAAAAKNDLTARFDAEIAPAPKE
ncbi:MAG: ABC transporter substrate-binding protein [Chloroflexi bacterium]|nr:ABC transporter substrate-binding protein [Chloroflexota bacterium]